MRTTSASENRIAARLAPHSHALLLLAVLMLLGLAGPLAAQEKKGLFVGFGLGWGSAGVSCEGCGDTDRESGFAGSFRIGGALSNKVLLGAESEGWYKSEDGSDVNIGTLTASVYFYPTGKGIYLHGGLGVARFASFDLGDSDTGFGFNLGAGYDIPISRTAALSPYLKFMYGSFSSDGFGYSANVIQLGLAITFY